MLTVYSFFRDRVLSRFSVLYTNEMVVSPLAATVVASLHSSLTAGFRLIPHMEPGTSTSLPFWYNLLSVKVIGFVG